ncbi:YopX family protein [Mammaliicoccus sciuri]|uniref:YopX family protein n=1 Tax=Mammaliicoccus sciuri TaxID=1296 RepID=UPI001E2992C1|nr:YopX family protein [Mammaliicoccus sciuri]MCD8896570.1 YopX family protein [Mammaliicoccus sciuri]
MNRPKFRVWDIEEQKWYKPTYKAYMKQLHDIHIDLDGSLLIRTIDDSGKNVTIHESMFEGRYELLQSTGLLDKNGTEIFEGHIVKDTDGYVGYIAFLKQEMGYVVVYKTYDKRLGHRYRLDDGRLEILGNIYQDKHLLGED